MITKIENVKLISPKNILIKDIPNIIIKAFIAGPKFIINNIQNNDKIKNELLATNNFPTEYADELDKVLNTTTNKNNKHNHNYINTKILDIELEKWLKNNNLMIQPSDKNLCITLIDKDIYNEHLSKLVNNKDSYTEIKFDDAIKIIKSTYTKIYNTYHKFHKDGLFEYHIKNYKDKFGIPNLYLIPKIHKPKLAFRPIVNQRNYIFTDIYKSIHTHYCNKLNTHKYKKSYIIDGNNELLKRLDNINNIYNLIHNNSYNTTNDINDTNNTNDTNITNEEKDNYNNKKHNNIPYNNTLHNNTQHINTTNITNNTTAIKNNNTTTNTATTINTKNSIITNTNFTSDTIDTSIKINKNIQNINFDDLDIISLDVTNLYGNIDLKEIIKTIKKTINYDYKNDYFMSSLVEKILFNNIIEINNTTYIQNNGLAMGINYAPSLANYYLFYNFDLTFHNLTTTGPIILYTRYLDDILIIYNKNTKWNIHKFIQNVLNTIHPSIQFTIEESINNSINFLDLTITIDKSTRSITYTNYTKAFKTCMFLHEKARYKPKAGLIKSQFIRLMKNNNREEGYNLDTIKMINELHKRGYSKELIRDNIISYNERDKYMSVNDIKAEKLTKWKEQIKDKKLLILNNNNKINLIKSWLYNKSKEYIIIEKNFQNLYTTMYKNFKNTSLRYVLVDNNQSNKTQDTHQE